MEKAVFTKKDLCERWECSIPTIDKMVKERTLHPLKGLPIIRFSLAEIQKIEEVGKEKLDPLSPFERRRLERENSRLEEENRKLRIKLSRIAVESATFVNEEVQRGMEGNR